MQFDLSLLDFTKEIADQLRKQHYQNINNMIKEGLLDNDDNKKVTLFHGTDFSNINSILYNGLETSGQTNRNNYEGELKSHEELIYLTNKWHYWYAYKALEQAFKDNEHEGEHAHMPCYIECSVPASKLVMDEDFIHSMYVKNRIKTCLKKKQSILELTYEESLNQYGTVAHFGKIERKDIVSFTVLSNIDLFFKNFINEKSQYQKDLQKWGNGKGKGSLKLLDLFRLEDDAQNLTFPLKDIPEKSVITEYIPKTGGNTAFQLRFAEVETKEGN